MVFGRNEGGSSRHRQSIKGGPKKIHFQLAVNEQGVCVRLCVCMCVCVGGGGKLEDFCFLLCNDKFNPKTKMNTIM